jgi:hypothetical protein
MEGERFVEGVIPCVAMLGFFFLVFGFILLMRYLRYRETLALAEKGLLRPDRSLSNGKDTLRWGIAITAVGLALSVGLYPMGYWVDVGGQMPLHFGPWMLIGLIPMFFGLGLVLIYVLTRDEHTPPAEIHSNGDEDKPAGA